MSEVLEKAILAEVEPGKTYIIAIKRGNLSRESSFVINKFLKTQHTKLIFIETYDNPADCLLFNARKEETVNA